MAFDADLVLMDGSIVCTASTDTPAISTTRLATTGAAVLDIKETGVKGLAAVLIFPTDLVVGADAYTCLAYLEASDIADMTGTTAGRERLGSFGVASATIGTILGSEVPCISIVRFATTKRYIRVNLTVDGSFGYIICLLTPHVFERL